jgi:hypothetical protein
MNKLFQLIECSLHTALFISTVFGFFNIYGEQKLEMGKVVLRPGPKTSGPAHVYIVLFVIFESYKISPCLLQPESDEIF